MFKLQQSIQEEEKLNIEAQIEQKRIVNKQQLFNCNNCLATAVQPVVSKCGHLFCWSCIYDKTICSVCSRIFNKNQFIPIYTSHQQQVLKQKKKNIPEKPKAKNQQKIRNSSSGFSNQIPYDVQLQDNIHRQIRLSGFGYFPPTFIGMFNRFEQMQEDVDQFQESETIKFSTSKLQLILIAMVCFLIILS